MKNINIKTIHYNGGTQSRVEINQEIVAEYAEAIKGGAEFPPVVIFNDGVENWLADGFHRFHAHGQAGKTSIAADVRKGTERDAILFSLGANGQHGLRRTNADKRKAVMTILNDFNWSEMSGNKISEVCCVSIGFVSNVKASLLTVNSEKPKEVSFKTKHGTVATMQTANIGKKKPWESAPITEELAAVPDETFENEVGQWRDRVQAEGARVTTRLEKAGEKALKEDLIIVDECHNIESDEAVIERLSREKMELLDRLEVLLSDDLAKKLNDQQTEIYGLRGRVQQMLGENKANSDKLNYFSDLLHKLR